METGPDKKEQPKPRQKKKSSSVQAPRMRCSTLRLITRHCCRDPPVAFQTYLKGMLNSSASHVVSKEKFDEVNSYLRGTCCCRLVHH